MLKIEGLIQSIAFCNALWHGNNNKISNFWTKVVPFPRAGHYDGLCIKHMLFSLYFPL